MKTDIPLMTQLFLSTAEKYPWVFDKKNIPIQINVHLEYLAAEQKSAMLRYVCHPFYTLEILERFKDYHISTVPVEVSPQQPGSFSILFQPSNEWLLQITLGVKDKHASEFICIATIHTINSKHYINFLKDYYEYMVKLDDSSMGFVKS